MKQFNQFARENNIGECTGAMCRSISELAVSIADHAYEGGRSSVKLVNTPAEHPEPKASNEAKEAQAPKTAGTLTSEYALAAACGLLPAALCTGCLIMNAPRVVTGLMTAAGGVVGLSLWHRHTLRKEEAAINTADNRAEAKPKEEIRSHLDVDEEELTQSYENTLQIVNKIQAYAEKLESDLNGIHDIALDRQMGEWVQDFLVSADKSEDRAVQLLCSRLIDIMSCIGITIYDEILLKEDGTLDIPRQDYMFDARTGDEYTEIVRPAIYSEKGLLARGKIQ